MVLCLCAGARHVTRNPAASVVLVDDPLPLTYDEELQLFSGLQPGDVFCYTVPIALSLFVASIAYNVAEVMRARPALAAVSHALNV